MEIPVALLALIAVLSTVALALSLRIVHQYEEGVLFRLGRVVGQKKPGLTRNVSVDVSAVAYYRIVDATKALVAIENVAAAINQIAQTTLRKVVGQHTLDETLAAAALGEASDIMMAHPVALQLRNLQSLVEIGVDKNTTVVFPAPLMSTIQELGAFLAREQATATTAPAAPTNGAACRGQGIHPW
jgi:SPFH domain / Band 7 family